jgi:DNA-binding transcriptional ArsR family regulator
MRKPKEKHFPKAAVQLFRSLGQPARLEILLAIGIGEACVCHLEAALGQRQAYISQQLMALRNAGLVNARREGRNIFYRLANPEILSLIQETGRIAGIRKEELDLTYTVSPLSNCCCPHCAPEQETELILKEDEIQAIGN